MKNSEKTVFTVVQGGAICGVYTNLKALHDALFVICSDDESMETLPTYAKLVAMRKKAKNENVFFGFLLQTSDRWGMGDADISEVFLNR
jgi:hypothetical protein